MIDGYWLTLVAVALAGVFGWTFTEYAMHNWRGHKGKGRNDFSKEHLAHHAKSNYFTPARKKVMGAIQVSAVVLPLGWFVMDLAHGAVLTVSFVGSYAAYELLHRRLHTHPPKGFYGRWARKHHFFHHFSRPNHNHGVTSPIWDAVFGTLTPVDVVRVPVKQAMVWLVDPATGEVFESLRGDYEIVRRGSRRSDKPQAPGAGRLEVARA